MILNPILLGAGIGFLIFGHVAIGVGLLAFVGGHVTGWRKGIAQTSAVYQRYIRSAK